MKEKQLSFPESQRAIYIQGSDGGDRGEKND